MSPKKEKTFEQNCHRLEEIVEQLEDEQLSLEKSIELFTEGVELASRARKQLESGEQKVRKLISGLESRFELEDFDREGD